jgi:hypothetical protein
MDYEMDAAVQDLVTAIDVGDREAAHAAIDRMGDAWFWRHQDEFRERVAIARTRTVRR